MERQSSETDEMPEEVLQQLRQWQEEQKNRLIEQQQNQRLLLLEKQKKLLSMINNSDVQSAATSAFPIESPSDHIQTEDNQTKNDGNFSYQESPKNVDDVPLKKPRSVRTFQQLIETTVTNKDQPQATQSAPRGKKFPFLKRGQGISRFGTISKPQTQNRLKSGVGKENKLPNFSTENKKQAFITESEVAPVIENHLKTRVGKENKLPSFSSNDNKQTYAAEIQTTPIIQKHSIIRKPISFEPLQSSDVNVVALPTVQSVDESLREINSSRTEEELAVFELLERFANINASFSSSSSLIGQLIDKGVTHLPSPSKVINFLSKKQTDFSPREESAVEPERKSGKPIRHVRFAESIEEEDSHFKPEEEFRKPWLTELSDENTHAQTSPYVSNTIHRDRPSNQISSIISKGVDLNETPTSPIGFPDYQKLFANPIQSLWTNEEAASPREDSSSKKSVIDLSDPTDIPLKETLQTELDLPTSLPVEDPRVVYQTSLLRSRLTSLEREIANYRRETDALRRARKEHEESKQKLEQEQEKFRRYTENEKRRLQLLYSEEQKRVRTEQLKDLPQLKEYEDELKRAKEELTQAKEEHRQKENKWMANQTKVQEKIRAIELRNRELTEALEKVRAEEQSLRRRLNASLRPGALSKASKAEKANPINEPKTLPSSPMSPQLDLVVSGENGLQHQSPGMAQKDSNKTSDTPVQNRTEGTCVTTNPSPGSGNVSQTLLPDGTKLILYPNGNRKEIWPLGRGTQVIYYNGDIKQKLADGSVVYTYADSGTKHTTKPDGTEILEFASGQVETTFPDGRSHVKYPGGAQKTKYPNGREEAELPDGTKLWTDDKGHGVMTFPSGIREIYTSICKRREYPDGTVKTVYEDGRSETRYANGRIRVKDSAGKILTDTGEITTQK